MNKEKQRIKIAEACGWRLFSSFDNLWAPPGHVVEYDCDAYPLPDYLNDLNAMHNAEKACGFHENTSQGRKLTLKYFHLIGQICESSKNYATAAQRAEAFLKTLNLWEQ